MHRQTGGVSGGRTCGSVARTEKLPRWGVYDPEWVSRAAEMQCGGRGLESWFLLISGFSR